jgi:hypothetical protein
MMKKLFTLFSLLSLLLIGCLSVSAMDSDTLLNNSFRYRVIGTQPDGIVYVDMETLQGMQTMDYPNSIENVSCKLYVEKYNSTIDAMTFQNGQLIRQINEYDAKFHANKRENKYELDAKLNGVFTPQGTAYEVKLDTFSFKNIKEMFIGVHRLEKLPKG